MKTGFKSIETRKAHHIHKILQFNIQVREGETFKNFSFHNGTLPSPTLNKGILENLTYIYKFVVAIIEWREY